MKTRPALAAVFVACCLLLCGLILRHQIAAHPLPPETASREEDGANGGTGQRRFWMKGWHPAPPALSALAHTVVAGQVTALAVGDGPKAWGYQGQMLRQNFGTPDRFMQVIARQYPEFLHPSRVDYWPVLTDASGTQAREAVLLEGKNGRRIWAGYQLVRENGQFKVGGVETLPPPDQGR